MNIIGKIIKGIVMDSNRAVGERKVSNSKIIQDKIDTPSLTGEKENRII